MEIWKAVVGWEGVYAISNIGRLRYAEDRPSHRYAVRVGFIVPQSRNSDGYAIVSLARLGDRAKRRSYVVAALVAEAFIGARPAGFQVNHKNTCRADDAADNLEWVTCLENVRHSARVGVRVFRGVGSPSARLTEAQVVALRERAVRGETFKALGFAFGITNVAVAKIATGISYSNAPGPLSAARGATEKKRLGIPNHAVGVRSNRQHRE